ncbi:MAG: flagellar biosynthetic protein FliR [Pseudomonadota bacterium]
MSISLLNYFVISQLTAFIFLFARIGAALMVMPGIGDPYVSPRMRLIIAVAISIVLTPLMQDRMPAMPDSIITLTLFLIGEILIGAFIGMIARTILSALHTAGTIIAYQSSLAVSSIFDPVTGAQTAVLSNFMTIVAMTLMFILNIHHLLIASVVESYQLFVPGVFPSIEDMSKLQIRMVADCFTLGVLLAAPHIVFSFIFNLMNGLMARLMPNFQIFFVMMSPQIIIAFLLMFAILPVVMEVFVDFMQDQLQYFVGDR